MATNDENCNANESKNVALPRRDEGINKDLVMSLRALNHTMRHLYEGRESQKRALIMLNEIGGDTTQCELTRRMGIQPGSASELLAKLECSGYIMRTLNETDKRTCDVKITADGIAMAEQAEADRVQRHWQMFRCLSDDEKKELLALLNRLKEDWKERYDVEVH